MIKDSAVFCVSNVVLRKFPKNLSDTQYNFATNFSHSLTSATTVVFKKQNDDKLDLDKFKNHTLIQLG